uniref:F-box associated domain-containing protein n=1 Tax=Triticum aestivum TaxID=4565 RepID=A0A077RRL6_WHEAT|nr:unnamed protein product [Triticum aestivum]
MESRRKGRRPRSKEPRSPISEETSSSREASRSSHRNEHHSEAPSQTDPLQAPQHHDPDLAAPKRKQPIGRGSQQRPGLLPRPAGGKRHGPSPRGNHQDAAISTQPRAAEDEVGEQGGGPTRGWTEEEVEGVPPPPRAGRRPPATAARGGRRGWRRSGENLIAPESPAGDDAGVIIQPMPEGMDFVRSDSRIPVLLHHCLHWIYDHNRLVVFDTVVESFRWMRSPIGVHRCRTSHLHEMQGMLAITGGRELLKTWALTDYGREVWSFMRQIFLPKVKWGISRYTVVSGKANTEFLCSTFERMFHYSNNKGKWLEEFQQEPCRSRIFSNHLFKESLISHSFFPMQSLGGKPYFLRGLGTLLMLDDLVSCSVYLVPCVQYIRSKIEQIACS